MSLLVLDGVQKHFGSREVLRGASFRIDPGEKVGLVGRNGGGKTTILRLIEGLETETVVGDESGMELIGVERTPRRQG